MIMKTNFVVWVVPFLQLLQIEGQLSAKNARGTFMQELERHFNEISDVRFIKHIKKLTKASAAIGQMCFDSSDCRQIGPGVECSPDHICRCDKHHILVQANKTKCLPGVLLGFSCEDSAQCRLKVTNSLCVQGYCSCELGFAPYNRANCLKGSKLGETCRTHDQCSIATQHSGCHWIIRRVLGHCRCKKGMPRRGQGCSTPGYTLGAPCGRSLECAQHVPGSICVEPTQEILEYEGPVGTRVNGISSRQRLSSQAADNFVLKNPASFSPQFGGICLCPRGHLAIENYTKCVPIQKDASEPSASLGKPCRTHLQCKASDPFSLCKNQVCVCASNTADCSPQNTGCFNGTFQCVSDGRCISGDFVCNGQLECKDGSDEADCIPGRCSPFAFTCRDGSCLSRGKVCDAKPHCSDGSDELNCFFECPKSTFRCDDGQCLPGYSFCNAHYDCADKSDESIEPCVQGALHVPECPFRCRNQRCRSKSILCSGIDGCGDGSDEEKCSVCSCPRPEF